MSAAKPSVTLGQVLFLVVPSAVLLVLRFPHLGHVAPLAFDPAYYVALGLSLASGRGYHEIWEPLAPAHTFFPPGYPALLSVIWRLWPDFPANLLAMQLVSFLGFAVFLALSHRLCTRFLGAGEIASFAIHLTLAANYAFVIPALAIASDAAAAPWIIAALIVTCSIINARQDQWEVGKAVWLAVLLAGAFYLRTANVALALACPLALLIRKQYRAVIIAGASLSVLVAPWLFWVLSHRRANYVDTWLNLGYKELGLFRVVADNLSGYIFEWIPRAVSTVPVSQQLRSILAVVFGSSTSSIVADAAALMVTTLAVWGFVRLVRQSGSVSVAVYVMVVFLVLSLWPQYLLGEERSASQGARFLFPVAPFLIAGIVRTLSGFGARFLPPPAAQRAAMALLLFFATFPNAAQTIYYTLPVDPDLPIIAVKERGEKGTIEALTWIRTNTPEDAVIVSSLPVTVFLYTGRKPPSPSGMLAADEKARNKQPPPIYYISWGTWPPLKPPLQDFIQAPIDDSVNFTLCHRTTHDVARIYVASPKGEHESGQMCGRRRRGVSAEPMRGRPDLGPTLRRDG